MFASNEEYTQRRARLGIVPASPIVRLPKKQKPRDIISIEPSPEPIGPMRLPDDDKLASMAHLPAWRRIIMEVGEKHGFTLQAIVSARRDRKLVIARQEAMWRMWNEENMSQPRIGSRLGGRDHTTVLHGIRQHKKRMALENVSTANKENEND